MRQRLLCMELGETTKPRDWESHKAAPKELALVLLEMAVRAGLVHTQSPSRWAGGAGLDSEKDGPLRRWA